MKQIPPLQIFTAPEETIELFVKAKKELHQGWQEGSREWFNRRTFILMQSFAINDFLKLNVPQITVMKHRGTGKKLKIFQTVFLGTPTQLKKSLEKTLDELERKKKLRAFK